jgi:ribosomal protein L40E
MRIRHKSDRLEIEVEGSDVKECFTELANAVEVFSNSVCGACDSTNTSPAVREREGNVYHEMVCRDCGATLGFGQTRVGGKLFPRRKGKDGSYLPGNGWQKWQPKQQQQTTAFDDAF